MRALRLRRVLRHAAVVVLGVVAASGFAGFVLLRGSLPAVEGQRPLAGLKNQVIVERDQNGGP